jgi:murein DD-endopeptidase MepM/ murein hydrolase activator NlpD
MADNTMSNIADNPDSTTEDTVSAEDLMDLLAPGAPAAAPGTRSTLPPPATNPRAVDPHRTAVSRTGTEPMAVPEGDLVAPHSPASPLATSAGPALRGATVPGSGSVVPLRVGSRFQPMPGPLSIATGDRVPGSGLMVVVPAGTPVHAIEAGTVTLPAHTGEPLRLAADSGLTFCYGGLAPGSLAVSDGTRVAAGMILGAVAATKLSTTAPPAPSHLVLRIVDAAGADVDVPGFLVGLPDPNELGHAAVGTGMDVDPDVLDLEIARASGTAAPSWGRTP